ncbi:alpha/beta hydrolase [Rhodococcus sp. T7]|uniref:alpha/beta hydrolase n=1 Tax=Rhodococcus sp. T7 TaxID=627444 RepID=UPI00135C791E|nr:alpha/beta hydrolase [Rhodococcus sp. T7]KAF0957119.1 Monoterpene epsilon-lactone hydrolase [Rhodococcus sp. T7]KAF0958844.1 Monoterpene epsilon-lactone hydrolase [Rhodococcus sp. T7]
MTELTGREMMRNLYRLIEGDGLSLDDLRSNYDKLIAHAPVPADISVSEVDADGVRCLLVGVAGTSEGRTIVWFHSGGYMVGSADAYQNFGYQLSKASGAQVLLVDYRLAPEDPYPAPIEDAVTAARWAIRTCPEGSVVIGGDSAGGGLCIAANVILRDAGLRPAAAIALSPLTDLAGRGESMKTNGAGIDYACTPETVAGMAQVYYPNGDPLDPKVSPIYDELHGLPPLYVTAGSIEALLDDSTRLVEKVNAAGGDAILEIGDDLGHIWPTFFSILPEGQATLERLGGFVRTHAKSA